VKQYLILVRSITYAQRLERALERVGIRSQIGRAPMELTGGRGCAYAVRISQNGLTAAKKIIRGDGFGPVQIWLVGDENFQEAEI